MIEICAIVRDENEYLPEWISYHLGIGFDRVVLYDNGSKVTPSFSSEKVIVRRWEANFDQVGCYNAHAHNSDAEWVAFIDVDEFIVLERDATIQEFMDWFDPDVGAVCLHWICYGANGHWKKPGGGVMESYTKPCTNPVSDHYKTIARPHAIRAFVNPHHAELITMNYRTVNPIDFPVRPDAPVTKIAHINHYFTKSYEEWLEKVARGRADTSQKRSIDEFYWYNEDMKSHE